MLLVGLGAHFERGLDLDNFKYVNDSHGHVVGDSVLIRVARLLRVTLRTTDVVARLGGDEFAVLLVDVTSAGSEAIAHDLLDEVRSACFPLESGHQLRLTVSVGITTFDGEDQLSPAELLVNADIAMYDAKEAGATGSRWRRPMSTRSGSSPARPGSSGYGTHGCEFALDDFGAGFGGFYYVKYLPCQYLKIDGEFIRVLPSSPVDQVFVRPMVEHAHGLGKLTIAEFVQDEETLQLLRVLGVDYAQGSYIGPPARTSD